MFDITLQNVLNIELSDIKDFLKKAVKLYLYW